MPHPQRYQEAPRHRQTMVSQVEQVEDEGDEDHDPEDQRPDHSRVGEEEVHPARQRRWHPHHQPEPAGHTSINTSVSFLPCLPPTPPPSSTAFSLTITAEEHVIAVPR